MLSSTFTYKIFELLINHLLDNIKKDLRLFINFVVEVWRKREIVFLLTRSLLTIRENSKYGFRSTDILNLSLSILDEVNQSSPGSFVHKPALLYREVIACSLILYMRLSKRP